MNQRDADTAALTGPVGRLGALAANRVDSSATEPDPEEPEGPP
jgi:hypothetical protein